MVSQDVLDCVDRALWAGGFKPRVDTSGPMALRDVVAKFEERAEKVVTGYMRRISSGQYRQPYVFFCENESYGAAALSDRYDYIILHVGIVSRLLDYCQRMMAVPGLWAEIGKPNSRSNRQHPATESDFMWPDDPTRQAFGCVFAMECFDLIVRHELAHLVLGHCQFKAAAGHGSKIEDMDGRLTQGIRPLTAQVLELAADGHAAVYGAQGLSDAPRKFGRVSGPVDAAYREFHRTPISAKMNYLLAMYFVFRLMDEIAWNTDYLLMRSHPPAPIRFYVACIHLDEHFRRVGNADTLAQWLEAMSQIWELGEESFANTLGQKPNAGLKHQTLSEESERHYNRLSDHAQTLPSHLFEIDLRGLN